ncbi:MAG TPA: DUF4167 domain-containing protein [Hyphomicrobiaceae bacterium]|jgi:hypothetical protein
MKQNNNNRRARGRGPRKPHGMGGGGHNKGQGYDSGGQELRVRGNAYQVLEKYLQLARDAGAAGDRVAAENFLQHADHYYRVLSSMNDGQRPRVGGRELSVADVNVQNVSQGLSAALYSGGGNPQGMSDPGVDGAQGQNQGNQGGQGQGGQGHGGQGGHQGGHRQGGHQQGGHQQGGHQQNVRAQGDSQPQSGGNAAPTNGHGNTYGNYTDRNASQPSYSPPTEPARPAATSGGGDDQPDYPDDLLASGAAPAAQAAPEAVDDPEDGVQRTLRAPRARLRGPGRRGPRQGDGRQGEGRETRQGDGQGPGDSSE